MKINGMTVQVEATPALLTSMGGRVTKQSLRVALKATPNADFFNRTFGVPGTYVSGSLAVRYDLTLEVMDANGRSVAMVNFQQDGDDLQAVVR